VKLHDPLRDLCDGSRDMNTPRRNPMRRRAIRAAASIVGVALTLTMLDDVSMAGGRTQGRSRSREVQITQPQGRLPGGDRITIKGTPEGSTGSAKAGPTAPATCDQQNASSQACYSATQQARPVPR
jgi:hypothetical protein